VKEQMSILAGVFVFVICQFILKLVIDPIVVFRTTLGELSAFFLREQAKITNANAAEDIQIEIKHLSSSILAHKQAITGYRFFMFILRLPDEKNLIEACHALNLISHYVNPNIPVGGNKDRFETIHREMEKISVKLKVIISYTELYRDRDAPHGAPLPHHRTYGSVSGDSADQASSDPGEHKSE
jgi:hypothetical protein